MEDSKLTHFLIKLWSMLEDVSCSGAIVWDRSGTSFHIIDYYKLCEEVLLRFFKSKCMSSFVRQLNLYGFKKITTIDRSTLAYNDQQGDHMQFAHPFFRRDQPNLLKEIKRNYMAPKRLNPAPPASTTPNNAQFGVEHDKMISLPEGDFLGLLEELESLRIDNSHMHNTISELTRDNELLWNEIALLRDSHQKQQQNVSKLVQFLISLVQTNAGPPQKHGRMGGGKRIVPIEENMGLDFNPLAITPSSQQSWDASILACIQQDILKEALNYNEMSALSPPAELQPSSPPNNMVFEDSSSSMLQPSSFAPPKKRKQNLPSIRASKMNAGNSVYTPGIASPRHQLSMQLSNRDMPSTSKAVFPVKQANNQQLVHASSGLIRMGHPYAQIKQEKYIPIASSSRVSSQQQHFGDHDYEEPLHEESILDDYYFEDNSQMPCSSSSIGPGPLLNSHANVSEIYGMDETNDDLGDFVHVEPEDGSQIHAPLEDSSSDHNNDYLFHSTSAHFDSSNGHEHHEVMLYDAMNVIEQQHEEPWTSN